MQLDRIVFLGRTFDEYRAMFGLTDEDLARGPVLDCPAGAASFAVEARERGYEAVSCDSIYSVAPDELRRIGEEDIAHVFDQFDKVSGRYVWKYYRDKDDVIAHRRRALELFVADYEKERDRYVDVKLPALPFAAGEFSTVLSANLLFMYGEWFPVDFHLRSLEEMLRVARDEVRVFPLLGLDGRPYDYLGYVLMQLASNGVTVTIRQVPFEFQRGGNVVLSLRKTGRDNVPDKG
jgi:hypothetical protein